jgi:polysaccharide biosynthesis transport protein
MSASATASQASVPSDVIGVVTVQQVWQRLKRDWLWIALPTLLTFIGSVVFVLLATPRYTAETKLLLEHRESFYTRFGNDRSTEREFDEQAVASQVQLLQSRDVALEAIRRLKLVGKPEFDKGPDSGEYPCGVCAGRSNFKRIL